MALPLADLHPNEWLVISTVKIVEPQTLTLRWLQAYVLRADDPNAINGAAQEVTELIIPGLGLAYVGFYRNFDALTAPASQAAQEVPLVIGDETSLAPVSAIRPLTQVSYTASGAYSFVICNNTSNRTLRVVVNGQIRAMLGIPPP